MILPIGHRISPFWLVAADNGSSPTLAWPPSAAQCTHMNAIGGGARRSTAISGGILGTARPRNAGAPGDGRRYPTRGTPPRRALLWPVVPGGRSWTGARWGGIATPRERQGRAGEHGWRHTTPHDGGARRGRKARAPGPSTADLHSGERRTRTGGGTL